MDNELIILLVEDDPGHASLIKKNLKRAGVKNKILHFSDGEEILEFLFNKKDDGFDKFSSYLMILDIRMPKIDGIEVLKKVREDKSFNRIPIIVLTTTDNPDDIKICHELGCNNYITKPVDYDKFVDVLSKIGLFLTVVKVPK